MAEFLIKAVSATHSDPEKDQRGCYKRGDIVDVRPDGFEWGRKEVLPPADGGKFVRIQITGVTPEQVHNWCLNRWGVRLDDSERNGESVLRRRLARVDVDLVPNAIKQQLNTTGFYANTWQNIRTFIRNKVTGQTGSGNL